MRKTDGEREREGERAGETERETEEDRQREGERERETACVSVISLPISFHTITYSEVTLVISFRDPGKCLRCVGTNLTASPSEDKSPRKPQGEQQERTDMVNTPLNMKKSSCSSTQTTWGHVN